MDVRLQNPELKCMESENYKKYFRILCWSGTRFDKKPRKKFNKKDRLRRLKTANALAVCYAPALLGNPSQFAVYATVRKSILSRCRQLQTLNNEYSDESDGDDPSVSGTISKIPKITTIGLKTVFTLVSQARLTDQQLCGLSLKALLDVLQGHAPEDLVLESNEVISNLHGMLVEISSGNNPNGRDETPTNLTAISSSCLMALSVARGEAELILNAVTSLIMVKSSFTEQYVQIPVNLTMLQRSVQSVILGPSAHNIWLNYGVPHKSLVTSFPVDLPPHLTAGPGELVVRSLASDGCYLYVYTSKGLIKIGSGYGSSIRQHIYLYQSDFFASDRHGWLGYCKNKLYVRIGRKKTEVYEVEKDMLVVKCVLRLDPGEPAPAEPKSAVFTDGNQLGLILLTNFDNLSIKMYDVETNSAERTQGGTYTLTSRKEINVHLLRQRTLALGRAPFEDGLSRRTMDLDAPVAMQLDDNDDDPLMGISAGQDFGLLITSSGKVYYTGKGTSLGYKVAAPHTGKWTLMKETLFSKNEAPNVRKNRVVQVAVGHEGVHAILVLDSGSALFTGIARRGEDGDANKHRRTPKPTRPKKILKADGHFIVYAACNYGSTALVTRQGHLLMFGKDTQHCDSAGLVVGLMHEKVLKVALGKAHAVVLTNNGQVYTFGINNKGQCGREFGYTKEKPYPTRHQGEEARMCQGEHTWVVEYCRVCVSCNECTGFSTACHCANHPNRVPGEKCGCGEGDAGCSACGVCRLCADTSTSASRTEQVEFDGEVAGPSTAGPSGIEKTSTKYVQEEAHCSTSEPDRDSNVKVSCLPPARVMIPGGHKVAAVACGLHHTVLLTENGEVLAFGSNQYGALGAGDVVAHHRIVRVRVPRATAVAAGSNHTAVLTRDGELYTFGSYQKGSLGRPRIDEPRCERSAIWYATPSRVPRLGPRYACRAVWVSASGDQTFVQVSESLIKTDTLFSSTITANSNSIVILPNRPEHTFKCITINKNDGSCNAWTGPEQVDFVNSLACLDPLYDVLWCYQPQMRVMKCFNILAFDSHQLQRCCSNEPELFADSDYEYPNYGCMKRLEDFRHMESFEWVSNVDNRETENIALSNMSVLNQELAIPCTSGCQVTRIHAALHLIGCLDSLTYAHDNKLTLIECKRGNRRTSIGPMIEDFLTVNRFESHGGGWGYSGHSIEAIRFMCDTEILLGGFGLYGGRGDYSAKIKLYDIGIDGGDQEGDGELICESEEIAYECAPKDKFPILFETPISMKPHRWYVAWACINGPSSDCGSCGQAMVINDDIGFHFKTSKKSNNGTDVNAGQIPCLLYNLMGPDHVTPVRHYDPGEPVISLSKSISRKVTVACFRSLITLLNWSYDRFKEMLLKSNGQLPINYVKLTTMKHQKRLVYIIQACLRLVKSYINEIYPKNVGKRHCSEYMSYFDAIADVRNFIQGVMADQTPTCSMLPRRQGRSKAHRICYVQFALEMTNSILKEAHETIVSCFHAFFPTPTLKWNHLCFLLYHVKEGMVPARQIRELTSTCAAMCMSRNLCDVLQYVVPLTQSCVPPSDQRRVDNKIKDVPCKSATVPRASHSKPPPVPPRLNNRDIPKLPETGEARSSYLDWHLLDIIPKLLDIVLIPIKQHMMTRQCGQPHDHGEIKQRENLTESCCKFTVRLIAEMAYSAVHIQDDTDTKVVKHYVTPSRFMRVHQSRSWNTGNGSPDAIGFSVDRPGVFLLGACVYGGMGNFDYTLEVLQDVRMNHYLLPGANDDQNPANCWMSLESIQGSFAAADCQHDMIQIKFERPIVLKENVRYAIRFCNQGGRTLNGDCGLPSVKGVDGTAFHFSSCPLSFNGTTLARGQIPSLIYYSTTKPLMISAENADSLMVALRDVTLRVASVITDRCVDLFCGLRNELTAEDLRRNAAVLQQSPAINTLLPFVIANLDGLDDSKSVIQLLDMVRMLLPHVAAMNLLVPSPEEITTTTTTHFYTWVESEHPYKQATVSNMRVLFPPQVSWIVLEMDPRSITAQPEDALTIYAVAGAPKHKCHCITENRVADPPFRKRLIQITSETGEAEELDESGSNAPCMQYNCTYVSVTPKLANIQSDWPQKSLLIPGNEVIFSLETASDYLNEFNKPDSDDANRFGYRCLCVGYEDASFAQQRHGLAALEMELVHMGAACASRLLAPDLDIPPLSYPIIMDVQMTSMSMGNGGPSGAGADVVDENEALLLSRGLYLSTAPTVHQVLEGLPLLRPKSTERQFLSDFVADAEDSAGGRLARWLAPFSHVEPSKCELRSPPTPVRLASRLNIPIIIRDQYGEIVASRALKVEITVQRLYEQRSRGDNVEEENTVPNLPYRPIIRDGMCFHAITVMKAFQNFSFEELRVASRRGVSFTDALLNSGRVPVDRFIVHPQPDGSYVATWLPVQPGTYIFSCAFDDQRGPNEVVVEVAECSRDELTMERMNPHLSGAVCNLKLFPGRNTAGLRVRSSPSLQADSLGIVLPGSYVSFVEEVVNKDGIWVRLSVDSAMSVAACGTSSVWCMQYHRQLDRTLLVPIDADGGHKDDDSADPEDEADMRLWTDDDTDTANNDLSAEDRQFPFSIQCDLGNESDGGVDMPYAYAEPSKRDRDSQDDSTPAPSPKRSPRRNNGNSDEWWPPLRHSSSDNLQDVNMLPETEIIESEAECQARGLAQASTQTSPDVNAQAATSSASLCPSTNMNENTSPKRSASAQGPSRNTYQRLSPPPPPPLPARTPTPSLTPKKHAVSPTQAECLRAVFAALLWHQGIVHDAIACAAFLKFHPQLTKAGARVVTRVAPHIVAQVRPQRHSVEVTSAGQYLHIHPSTLETLTRSGSEAYSSRSRKTELEIAIREEDPTHSADTTPTLSVVNVLPPALRAIVALWDALYDADQLNGATDKFRKEDIENNENVDPTPSVPTGGARKKTTLKLAKKSSTVNCELCGGASVPSPLAAHMRSTHPGCRSPTARGYDRTGTYRRVENSPSTSDAAPTACGQLAQDLIGVKIPATLAAFQLWYIYCEKCRETALNATSGNKKKTKIVDEMYSRDELVKPFVDHRTMKDNAFFLLDLAPLTNSEPVNVSPWNEVAGRGPPTPPGSVWQPAPPFQCLPAFGAAPKTCTSETARYHSLGRQQPVAAMDTSYELGETSGAYYPRVPRSVSMGQAGGRNLAHAAKPALMDFEPDQQDTLSGAGSTLLTQPSAALQKLVGCGECPSDGCPVSAFEPLNIDAETLMRSPVLTFVLGKRNLPSHQQKMEAAVRMNTVRQYGFEALNWLLRSTTQATCAHDVMWWFCNALDKYARMIPPAADEDNKEAANDSLRISAPTASVSAMCPGGRAARNARAAFHSLLGSVSALAPSLPPASPANLQAVRCWALHYTQNDRAFLHRSQVFSVISKILSHAEEGAYEDGMVGALQESYHSVVNKQNFLWNCPDVTGWCDVNVSSRQGMAGALIDGSTETFWESGDEDRNRAKWVQVSYPSGSPEDKPHTICVHVDNSRDTVNKTLLMSFLFSGGTNDMCHMQDIEVDPKSATWISYTLPRTSSTAVRVRCEVRGPEASVRIRQVRVFAAPMPLRGLAPVSASQALHTLAERDTLRVFRLLTSQVFGKLLEWEHSASDSGEDAAAEEATVDDTDLREHVVGILFAGHKLTTLQAQVMAHIVCAIGSEASRVRDDWETALLCAEAERSRVNGEPRALAHVEVAPRGSDDTPVQAPDDIIPRPQATHLQDNFCFEMLSLLLALSGSAVGRVHLAQRTELLGDLLALLHTGSERVQRQVISLLRRMIAEIPPQKMLIALNYGADLSTRVTLLDHLVCYLGKAITVQMKVKGAGTASPGTVMMGTSVAPSLPGAWFMRGVTTKKHSHLVAKLLSDMAENKVTEAWGAETRSALAQYVCAVVQIDESERRPSRCVAAPAVWLALAALCVCEHEYVESGNGDGQDRGRDAGADTRPFCANHDDDITVALVECRTCGPLCAECDRFLHLNRVARTHQRQICKEEERAIRIDIHEGCGRAKLFWLLLLVDRRTLKALIEFRGMETGVGGEPSDSSPSAMTGLVGRCRFCGTRGNTGLLAIGNVCAEQQCQDYNNEACQRLLSCGHACGGVRGERSCLTCLFGCAGPESLRQDADDMCMICFTDPLQAAPAIQLGCGHIFHMHCCKKVLANKWNGPRITFSFSQCPICKENISHWTLEELLAPIRLLREEVQKKALMRMEYEGLSMGARAKSLLDPATYAMERYAYYVCHKCGKAYFGGLARCEAESNGHWEPSELVCGACSDVTGAHICPKHGVDFLEYKCRYCCSVAVFFCFGTSHFCNACHDDFQRVTNIPRHLLPHCPAGPKSEQLPGTADECPLHVLHPSTGEEFALGCGVCRHAHAF